MLTIFKAAFQNKLVIMWTAMFSYVVFIVFVLYKIKLWDTSLLKDTIFWIFGTAFILLVNLNEASKDEHYFRKLLLDNLKLILILEFFINFYTFSLFAELIFLPVFFLIIVTNSVAQTKNDLLLAKKLTDFMLGIAGIFLFIFSLTKVFGDYHSLLNVDNLRAFLSPICLTLAFLPFLYCFALFMAYETAFVRLDVSVGKRDKELSKFAKHKFFISFGLSLKNLNKFLAENAGSLWSLKSKEDLLEIIQKFKRNNR